MGIARKASLLACLILAQTASGEPGTELERLRQEVRTLRAMVKLQTCQIAALKAQLAEARTAASQPATNPAAKPAQTGPGCEPSSKLDKRLDAAIAEATAKVEDLETRLSAARCAKIRPRGNAAAGQPGKGVTAYRTPRAKTAAIKKLTDRLDAAKAHLELLRANDPAILPELAIDKLVPPICAGQVGRLKFPTMCWIQKIVSDTEMLVRVNLDRSSRSGGGIHYTRELLMVHGVPTGGLAGNSQITLTQVFKITGPTRYDTGHGGTKTVFIAELVPEAADRP